MRLLLLLLLVPALALAQGYAPHGGTSSGLDPSNNLSDLDNAGTARTNLGLGSAAVLDVGTAASEVVQLDGSAKLPAVDGSALTNLPAASRDLSLTVTPDYLWDPHVDAFKTGGSQAAVAMHGQLMSGGQFVGGRYAAACDGSTDYAAMPDATVGVPASYTIIGAFRTHSLNNRWLWGMTTSGLASTNSWGITMVTSTGKVQTQFGDGANYSVTESTNVVVSANTWHVVAVRYTDTDDDVDIFVDGVEVAGTKVVANASSTGGADNDFSFCRAGEYASAEWIGLLGPVAIYKTTILTDQNISDVTDDIEAALGL